MLSTFFCKNFSKTTVKEGYDLLTAKEKRQVIKYLDVAKLDRSEDFSGCDVLSIKPILSGTCVHIQTDVRTVRLTTRSFWVDSPAVRATKAIAAIGEAANQRESLRLAQRQQATVDALAAYAVERRRQLAVT